MAPKEVSDDEMITVGMWPFSDQISPEEYALLLDEGGNLNFGLLFTMYQIQQNAMNTAGDLFSGMNLHNTPADAFRHAYWNALLTREFGAEFARDFTSAHETGYAPYPSDEEAFMDLHNNAVGRDIAFSSPNVSDQQLQQKVMEALRGGNLYVWDGTDIYFSNMCPVCFFP